VPAGSQRILQRRVLLSDYALARSPGGQTWTGFRDTFEVDGRPVRDREARLTALLASGTPESSAQARRIALDNARYNIGDDVAVRNVNVPTMALDLMRPINRSRFSLSRSGVDLVGGTATWRLAFRERQRPTIIRDLNGRDRRASGSIWLDPLTGEVMKTTLQWEGEPAGFVTVEYGRDLNLGALVPVRMLEQYRRDQRMVEGEATYSNYRRFQTSARIALTDGSGQDGLSNVVDCAEAARRGAAPLEPSRRRRPVIQRHMPGVGETAALVVDEAVIGRAAGGDQPADRQIRVDTGPGPLKLGVRLGDVECLAAEQRRHRLADAER
jgi:hypothetical protein